MSVILRYPPSLELSVLGGIILRMLGAHHTGSVGVRGSNPLSSTKRVLDEHLLL